MRHKFFLIPFALLILVTACNKEDDFAYPPGTVGASKITNYPLLTLLGSEVVCLPKGSSYSEPGVNATEAGNPISYTVSGTVDTNTPGVYTLTYSAVNKDGFSASVRRSVAVYSTDPSAAANDLSGEYVRAATGATCSWTKLAPGVYAVLNPGGAVGATLKVILFNQTGFAIHIPTQISSDGNTTSSSSESYINSNPATYSLKILNPGYGTGLRTFVKQ